MTRRHDDRWWWTTVEPARVVLTPAEIGNTVVAPVSMSIRVASSDNPASHILVAITATRGSSASPPSHFLFFEDAALTIPIDPIHGYSRQDLGDLHDPTGDFPIYAYGYLLPAGSTVYMIGAGGVDTGFFGIQAFGVRNAVDVSVYDLAGPTPPDTTHGFAPVDGTDEPYPLWVFVGHTSSDTNATVEVDAQISTPQSGVDPVVATAGEDPTSLARTISVAGTYLGSNVQAFGLWVQFQAVVEPVTVPDFDLTLWTNVFSAPLVGDLVGQVRTPPPVTATNIFDADLIMASAVPEWRAQLVDATGTRIHGMADATIGDIVETLNDITAATVTIPLRTPAGQVIDSTNPVADLEVQIWRGSTLWLWGPITDPKIDGDRLTVTVHDAPWHLTRRHVGAMGNEFGGRPPYFHDPMVNLRFEAGSIAGWSILRTISIGEFVGFGPPDLTAVRVDPTRLLPSGEPAVKCTASLDPLDNYQLYQDVTVVPPQNGRALRMTLSGWWWIPSDGGFAPNNQRMGLLLAPLIEDPSLPADYYRPYDVGFSVLDDTVPRDQWFYQECEVDVPPGAVPREVHVAVCFPQGVSYIAGLDLQVDDGLLYDESPTTMGAGLVMHAQDPEFDRDDVNLDWWANHIGDREVREYQFADHTNIMDAINTLAREGWFDWWCSYTSSARVMNFLARRRGVHRPRCRIRVIDGGPSNVAAIQGKRTVGATSVAAQTRDRKRGNHERHATSDGLTLEEVFVADREPADYDLTAMARERVSLTSRPQVLTVSTHTGDERFLLNMQVGDTTDIVSTQPGALADGVWRLTARTTSPTRDAAELTFNPEPVTP